MKYCLIALLIVAPASIGSTFAGAHTERVVDVAMVSPVELNSPPRASDLAPGKANIARITYTPARTNHGPAMSPAFLNNENYNGDRHARLRGDRFEWQWQGNPK